MFFETVIASIIAFSGYFVVSFTGFGAGLIIIPLLLFFLDIKHVVPSVAFLNLIILIFLVYRSWRFTKRSLAFPVFSGAFITTMLGTYMLLNFQSVLLKKVYGVFVILFALNLLFEKSEKKSFRPGGFVGFLAGIISGLISALFGVGGPPVVIYFSRGLRRKENLRATLLFYFLLLTVWKIITYIYTGLVDAEVLGFSALLLPSSIIGMFIGSKAQGAISEIKFRKVVAITLIITGTFLTIL